MSVRLCADEVQPLLISVTDEGHQYNTCPSPSLPPLHRGGSHNHDIPAVIITDREDDKGDQEATVIDFDPHGDAENPLEWPAPFKWSIVTILTFMAFTVTMTCMSVVPLAADIVQELSGSETPSKSASVLLVTIWELGEAAGPLLIAPLSEMYGRYPVMNVCNILFIAATVMAASSQSVTQFVVARMLTGLVVAGNVLNPAIVGDIFISEQRGSAVSLIYLAPLVGGAVGPLIGSALAQAMGWRQVVWMTAALATVGEVVMFLVFKETYKVSILRKRAEKMMRNGLCENVKTSFDHESDLEVAALMGEPQREKNGGKQTALEKLRDSVLRPAYVLFGSGVLMAMSLFGAVGFTFFYVISTTLAGILEGVYGLSPVAIGSCFASFTVGSTISVFICNHSLDRIYIRMRDTHNGVSKPEFRLPLSIVGAFLLPIAVLLYGWIPQLHLPLTLLLLAVAFLGSALMLAMIPMMTYIVDAFGLYSASALTGVMVTRCMMGTFLPLTTAPLVEVFGYGWGFSVLAGVSFLMAPIPILIMRYGSRWRQFSKYSREQ